MLDAKKNIIASAVLMIVVMGAIPPWTVFGGPNSNYPGVAFPLGYHPIFLAPVIGTIDISRLLLQWILVAIIAGIAIYAWPIAGDFYRRHMNGSEK